MSHQQTRITTRIIKYWLPVLLMLGVMYYFSTDLFSGENTRGMIERVLSWVWPAGMAHIRGINFVVRKAMHFMEYAVLAGLVFRAFRAESHMLWRLRWALYTFTLVTIWAVLDELHQSQTQWRGGSIYDSILDASGGLFMLVIIALANYRRNRAKRST